MKLFKSFILLVVLAFSSQVMASQWKLYDEFMEMHYVDGRIYDYNEKHDGFTTSEGQSYGMFFALVQNDKEKFDAMLSFVENKLCEGSFENKLPSWKYGDNKAFDRNNATDSDMFIAYDLICAYEIYNDKSYLEKAQIILKKIKEECSVTSRMLGTLILPGKEGFKNDKEFIINPCYFPPFVMQKLGAYDHDYLIYYQNALQAITKGSESGFVADWLSFDSDGRFLIKHDTVGSYDAIRFYLWLGITSSADPNSRIMLSLYKNMTTKVSKELAVPEKVNLYTKEFSGTGNIGFDASFIPVTDYKVKDYFRTKVKNHIFKFTEYYSHCLALFATGFDEHRYRFRQNGTIVLGD